MSLPDTDDRLADQDEVFFRVFGHPVTYNEVHAVQLGLVIGVLSAALHGFGQPAASLALLVGAVTYAIFGNPVMSSLPEAKQDDGIGARTLRWEPWYATIGMVAIYAPYTLITVVLG